MGINKKIKAFTLAEMIVVLVVSSIVIAMGFAVLSMVRKQVQVIQRNYQKKQEIRAFEMNLAIDFNSRAVKYYPIKNRLILKNTKDSIQYAFFEKYIVRNKDTFQLEVKNKGLFLDGETVNTGRIDALKIEFSEHFFSTAVFIQQNKDASYYLNR